MGPTMKRRAWALLLLVGFVLPLPAGADPIRVVSMVLGEGLQQADRSGFYGELYTEIQNITETPSEFRVLPFKRTLRTFFAGEADCIWALDADFLSNFQGNRSDFIESLEVLESEQYLFSIPGRPKLENLSEVSGMTIAVLNGANIENMLEVVGADVVRLPSQEDKIEMLLAGRVDAIGGWGPDIYITLSVLGLGADQIEPILFIGSSGVRVVCNRSPETHAFILELNEAISSYRRSESFQNVLLKYLSPEEVK